MDAVAFTNVFNNENNWLTTNLPPTVKLDTLIYGYEYDLQELKRVVTRYGTSIVAVLFDARTNSLFQVYLPFTYVNRFTEDDLKIVKLEKFKFLCNGLTDDKKTYKLSIRSGGGNIRV